MKRLVSARPVQTALAWLVWLYVTVLTRTLRWRIADPELVEAAVNSPRGAVVLFWHGRLGVAMACLPFLRRRPRRVFISLSRDGEFIARAASLLGAPAIRGSAERPGARASKGGVAAMRQGRRFIADGGVLLITPDGPRGPANVMSLGPVQLARLAGCPVYVLGLAAKPSLMFRTWDAMRAPLPFASACLAVAGPLWAPSNLAPGEAAALREEWQAKMMLVQDRAEAVLAGLAG